MQGQNLVTRHRRLWRGSSTRTYLVDGVDGAGKRGPELADVPSCCLAEERHELELGVLDGIIVGRVGQKNSGWAPVTYSNSRMAMIL